MRAIECLMGKYASLEISNKLIVSTGDDLWSVTARNRVCEHTLHARESLFLEGDETKYLYRVVAGVMCNSRTLQNGRRQVISFPYPDDVIGLGHSLSYCCRCVAVSEARIRSIPLSALRGSIGTSPEVGQFLLALANAELARMQDCQLSLGRKTALERLAWFLLWLARKGGLGCTQGDKVQIPMTRRDIADHLGLTIETISRNFTTLKRLGVIEMPDLSTAAILDAAMLQEMAEVQEHPL